MQKIKYFKLKYTLNYLFMDNNRKRLKLLKQFSRPFAGIKPPYKVVVVVVSKKQNEHF